MSCAVGAREPRHLRGGGPPRATSHATRPGSASALDGSARHPDRRRRPRRRLLLGHRAREGPADRGALRPSRGRGAAARLRRARDSSTPGLICRADDRGDPVVQLSPPLIAGRRRVRRDRGDPAPVLTEAAAKVAREPACTVDRRRPARGQDRRAPRRDHARRRARAGAPRRHRCSSRAAPATDSSITDDDYRAGGRRDRRRRRRRCGAAPSIVLQGEGAAGAASSRSCAATSSLFTYLHLAAYPDVADGAARRAARPASRTRPCSSRPARCRCSRR